MGGIFFSSDVQKRDKGIRVSPSKSRWLDVVVLCGCGLGFFSLSGPRSACSLARELLRLVFLVCSTNILLPVCGKSLPGRRPQFGVDASLHIDIHAPIGASSSPIKRQESKRVSHQSRSLGSAADFAD